VIGDDPSAQDAPLPEPDEPSLFDADELGSDDDV
jgi:hypothetical protein